MVCDATVDGFESLRPPQIPVAQLEEALDSESSGCGFDSLPGYQPISRRARFCLNTYYAELAQRFPAGSDPAVSPVADEEKTPPAGLLLVAALHGQPVGCGALIWYPDAVALVKRMWVAPSARGIGLGRRMLSELESRARDHGDRLVRLDTNAALTEALTLYRTCGYREVAPSSDEPNANHWFEKFVAESV